MKIIKSNQITYNYIMLKLTCFYCSKLEKKDTYSLLNIIKYWLCSCKKIYPMSNTSQTEIK